MAFGDYPAEYNPKTHGIYDPARYYGKREYQFELNLWRLGEFFGCLILCNKFFNNSIDNPKNTKIPSHRSYHVHANVLRFILADTPFTQVKVGEIGAWLGRRNKSPQAVAGAFSRAFWRWQHKYWQPKRAGIAPYFQAIAASMVFFYAINYGKISK